MALLFLDTSAFLKLYLPEKGSNWLQNFIIGKQLVMSELAIIESGVTLARLYRDNIYSKQQAAFKYAEIRRDRAKYELIPLNETHLAESAVTLAFNVPSPLRLRTLDAIHLAAAKLAITKASLVPSGTALIFLSADIRLLNSAQAQGFVTENPENHP